MLKTGTLSRFWNPAQIQKPLFWITFVFLDRNLVLSNGWPQVNIVAAAVEREMRSPVRDTPQESVGGNGNFCYCGRGIGIAR